MPRALPVFMALALALTVAPASAQRREPPPPRVRFTAAPGDSLLVHGEYPPTQSSCVDPTQPLLHARYRGTVEVLRAGDGSLSLIGELSFEDYLKGIAEVPRDWPMEALKAQVVAARTYALGRLDSSASGEYDLCATTECQVYVGMKIEAGPNGDRWVRAVQETAGEVLLYRGEPAGTFYSSTSPGRTFDVEDVFGGEALPYLRGGPERDDLASPLARWRVEVPFDDLRRFLSSEGLWSGGAIREIAATRGSIQIEGAGDQAALSKEDLRDALNSSASCLAPDRYPTYEQDGYRLPQTVPSRWYRAGEEGGALVLRGRGWGHGVGMVQWGAYGKAERGLGYDEILAAYYGGLTPAPADVPGVIRILIADGLTRLSIAPSGEAGVEPATAGRGPWLVTGGRGVKLRQGERPAPELRATGFTGPPRARPGQSYPASLNVSDDVSLSLEFLGRGGSSTPTATVVLEEEQTGVEVPVPELEAGRYEVRAVASDGVDVITTAGIPVRVRSAAPSMPAASEAAPPTAAAPADRAEDDGIPLWVVLVAILLAAAAVGLTLRRNKGLHRA